MQVTNIFKGLGSTVFLSEQCKETEENNIRLEISSRKSDTKGTFHAKRSTIKDRNGMDLTEAEVINKVARIHRTIQKKTLTTQIITMM